MAAFAFSDRRSEPQSSLPPQAPRPAPAADAQARQIVALLRRTLDRLPE